MSKKPAAPQPLDNLAFDQAEREIRRIVGGSLDSRQFYGLLGVVHTLTTRTRRKK